MEESTADVFGNIGLMVCEPVKIELADNAEPYCVNTARKVPFPLLPKVKEGLDRTLEEGIIEEVTELIDWCVLLCSWFLSPTVMSEFDLTRGN